MLLAGQPGTAKSIVAEHTSWATAYGQKCIGLQVKPGPVVYINSDHSEDEHRRWLQRFSIGANISYDPKYQLVSVHHEWSSLIDKQKEVEDVLNSIKPVLLVCDRLSTTLATNENHSVNVEPYGQLLRKWISGYKLTVIVLHHFTKEPTHLDMRWLESTFSQRLRGSGAVLGMADGAMEQIPIEYKTINNKEYLKEFGVRPHPKRTVILQPFKVELVDTPNGGVILRQTGPWHPVDSDIKEIANQALPLFGPGQELTTNDIAKLFGGDVDLPKLRVTLRYCRDTGKLKFRRGTKGIYVYTL